MKQTIIRVSQETGHKKMAGATRLELATFGVTGRRSNQTELRPRTKKRTSLSGRNRAWTCDPRLVRPMLSQLSYPPGSLGSRPKAPPFYFNQYHLSSIIFNFPYSIPLTIQTSSVNRSSISFVYKTLPIALPPIPLIWLDNRGDEQTWIFKKSKTFFKKQK